MKKIQVLSFLLFGLFFILGGYFYLERIIYTDSASMLFKLVNFSKLNVEASRYAAEIPKMIPLILVKAGLPLKWITASFSLSYIFLYFIIFLISAYILKDKLAGLLIILVLLLSASNSFYHPVTETHQTMAYSILLYSFLSSETFRNKKIISLIIAVLIISLCFFTHPVSLFIVLFILFFFAINTQTLNDYRIYLLASIIVGLFIIKTAITDSTGYEGQLLGNVTNTSGLINNFWESYTLKWFISKLTGTYIFQVLTFIGLCLLYLKRKEWKNIFLLGAILTSFIIFTVLAYYKGDNDTMLEKSFMPLSIITSIPLFSELKKLSLKWIVLSSYGIGIIIVFSMFLIIKQGKAHTKRIETIENILSIMEQKDICKAVISREESIRLKTEPAWAISNESIIISMIKTGKARTFFVIYDPVKIESFKDKENFMLYYSFYPAINYNILDTNYFNLCYDKYHDITDITSLNL